MTYQELKDKIRTGKITELTSPLSGRVSKVRWHNRRIETLAPPSPAWPHPEWQPRTKASIEADFLRDAIKVDESILDLIDYTV